MTSPCGDCDRPMVRGSHGPPPPGMVRHNAHGLCTRCYARIRRTTGHVPQPRPAGTVPLVDEIAVWRACQGDPVRLWPAERREAVAVLTRRGLSALAIAERLHCTTRTVVRHRHRLAAAAA